MSMGYIKKERLWVSAFLISICLVMALNVHNGWYTTEEELTAHPPPLGSPTYHIFGEPPTHTPEAYRVLVPTLGRLTMKILHVGDPTKVAAAFDFISGLLACYLFYRLAVDHLPETAAMARTRLHVIAVFLAFLQFPMAWIIRWQRPETLPSALFIAAVLFSLTRLNRSRLWIVVVLGMTVVQAFTRTDVPLIVGATVALLSLFPGMVDELGSRRLLFSLGSLIVLIDVSVQAYLKFIRFPNLHPWPSIRVMLLTENLHSFHDLSNVFIAVLPFLLVAGLLLVKRAKLGAIDKIVVLASVLYLGPYFALGIVGEVRLYVPFLFALCVVSAKFLPVVSDEYLGSH